MTGDEIGETQVNNRSHDEMLRRSLIVTFSTHTRYFAQESKRREKHFFFDFLTIIKK
jgi:hypothetical protein